jgi:hypothetical protein
VFARRSECRARLSDRLQLVGNLVSPLSCGWYIGNEDTDQAKLALKYLYDVKSRECVQKNVREGMVMNKAEAFKRVRSGVSMPRLPSRSNETS